MSSSTSRTVPALGVGVTYQPQLRSFLETERQAFDFVEIVPDTLWMDYGPHAECRYRDDPEGTDFLRSLREAGVPVVAHSIGLSIGSVHRFETQHVEKMAEWYGWLRFPWHSDHLSHHLVQLDGSELNLNLTMPVTLNQEMLDLIIARVNVVRDRIPVPFLLENNVYYFSSEGASYDEATFLSILCEETGAGLLLDLHNLHVNCVNRGENPWDYLRSLDLSRVVELHVAGGLEFDGMYLDAHSGPVPGPVWELLDWVLPRCPDVGGVVFELFGTWFDALGEERLRQELARLRRSWTRSGPTGAEL